MKKSLIEVVIDVLSAHREMLDKEFDSLSAKSDEAQENYTEWGTLDQERWAANEYASKMLTDITNRLEVVFKHYYPSDELAKTFREQVEGVHVK